MPKFGFRIVVCFGLLLGAGAAARADSNQEFFNRLSKEEIGLVASDAAAGNVDAKYFYADYLTSINSNADGEVIRAEAAAAGHPSAEYDLCLTESLAQDKPPSVSSCVRAALDGNPNAQVYMGLALSIGMFDLKQDSSAALAWYRMAAFQGDALALSTVGDQYSSGAGVQKDDALAIHYWERAASQDNAPALRQLGRAYALGWGVPIDLEKAKSYFTRASDLGDGPSQYYLGILYRVAGNFQSAYVMQTLALKTVEAGVIRDGVVKERIELQSILLPEQIKKSVRIAKVWRKKAPKPAPFIGGTDFIKRLQTQLNKRGFSAGDEDGIAGSATVKAYRQYADVLHIPNAPFDSPAIYYVAYRLNLYGKVPRPSQSSAPAPVVASQEEAPSQPVSGTSEKQTPKFNVVSTGSGFVVDHKGHVVTNAHVAKECASVGIVDQQGNKIVAKTIKVSEFSDLALIQSDDLKGSDAIAFRGSDPIKLGESVVVFGFPLAGTLSERGNLTVGNLAALSGLRDDPGMLQISAPVQPGNSGGPVLDNHGRLVGVVVAKLNAIAVANVTDDIPQNVNFAIKSSVLENFLQANAIEYQSDSQATKELPTTDLASLAQHVTVRIECYGP